MKKDINKLFNLQGLLVDKIEFNNKKNKKGEILIWVRNPRKFVKCPHCGQSTKRIHQVKYRLIRHGILDAKIIVLNVNIAERYLQKK